MKMFGLDYLGGAKYQQLILNEHPKGWAAGFFVQPELFGDPIKCIQQLADTGRCPAMRLHLRWEDTHQFQEKNIRDVEVLAKRYLPIIKSRKHIKWFVSGATEHLMKADLATKYAQAVQNVFGDLVTVVNNPDHRNGSFLQMPNLINEVHGTKQNPPRRGNFIYSYDGSNCVDDDIEARKAQMKNAEIFFFWHPAFNGRLKTEDTTKRSDRKSWPTSGLIDSNIYLKNDRLTSGKLLDGWIWKSHADRHDTPPEPRAYKPVIIGPSSANVLELVANNGQVIATSSARQSFDDGSGRGRWYFSNTFGYELAQKASRIQKGDPIVTLRAGKTVVGKVHPAFRHGIFRKE